MPCGAACIPKPRLLGSGAGGDAPLEDALGAGEAPIESFTYLNAERRPDAAYRSNNPPMPGFALISCGPRTGRSGGRGNRSGQISLSRSVKEAGPAQAITEHRETALRVMSCMGEPRDLNIFLQIQ